jgi:hypothetical protein
MLEKLILAWYDLKMNELDNLKVNKEHFELGDLHDSGDEWAFWRSKTPEERMEALEIMRQIVFGYDPFTERLQRVFEFAESA